MSKVYLTGGATDAKRISLAEKSLSFAFSEGLILELDTATRSVREILRYSTPADSCPQDNPSILFKAGSRVGEYLHLCTTTEIMQCRIGEWRIQGIISNPLFNDVHHVTMTPQDTRLVVSTGLDLVIEIAADGAIIREWDVLCEDPWQRFSRDVDYRRIHSTKPHKSHPNHLFFIGNEPFVTRHFQRDAVSLLDPERRINIALEQPHDGYVANGKVYFTTIDGHVVIADCESLQVVKVINLSDMVKSDSALGWCRGFHLLEDGTFLVGFSRLRPTKFKENVAWVKARIKKAAGGILGEGSLPAMATRISCFDPARSKHCWDVNIEDHHMQAVFSIL